LQGHGHAEPFLGSFAPPQQLGREYGMAIAKNIGPDLYFLADGSLDRKTAAIDEGINVLDVDAMSGKVADGPNAGIRCHGSIVVCWRPDGKSRIDGTDSRRLWFRRGLRSHQKA
jgi:hypothetical protein